MPASTESEATQFTGISLAKRLGVHKNTALKLLAAGEFPNAFRITRDWRIPESDIEAFIDRKRQAARDERTSRSAGKQPPAVS